MIQISEKDLAILLSITKDLYKCKIEDFSEFSEFAHSVFYEILKEKLNFSNEKLEKFVCLLQETNQDSWNLFIDELKEKYDMIFSN